MSSIRFDESFLAEQLKKREKWAKKGHKAGHGGSYNLDIATSISKENTIQVLERRSAKQAETSGNNSVTPFPISSNYLAALRMGIDVTDLPEWLIEIINNDDEIALALTTKNNLPDSPHKQALVSLANDYSLYTGRPATATAKAIKGSPEHYIQVRLFYELERQYPYEYYFTKSVPNGGLRAKKTRFTMQAEGQKKGAHDIDVDLARGKYHGMKLEVKTETGVLSKDQSERLERLNAEGYYCVHGKGFDECWHQLVAYFSLPKFDNKSEIIIE
ncbi:PDDEXK family nuclease [Photobacterium leiognathi]|uniref:hypothetical protein n=1 Tax=Photobacterium leiognathi TaxID=553611 RepID=UPI0029821A9E|nr:hypothetical protein [Photobacterium leiognathi]